MASVDISLDVAVTGKSVLTTSTAADNEIIKADDTTFGRDAVFSNLAVAARALLGAGASSDTVGFVVGGKVTAAGGMALSIAPVWAELLATNECVAVTEDTAGLSALTLEAGDEDRIDVVSVLPCPTEANVQSRAMNDPLAGTKTYGTIATQKTIELKVIITQGEAGAGVAPSVAGSIKLAEVHVAAGATEITDDDIVNVTACEAGSSNEGWTADEAAVYRIDDMVTAQVAWYTEHNADGTHGDKVIRASNINIGTGADSLKASVLPLGKAVTLRGEEYTAASPVSAAVESLAAYVDALFPYANDLLGRYTVASVVAKVATTEAVELSGLQSVDGVTLADGYKVLVKDQDDATENGLYVVSDAGEWTRHEDFAAGYTAFDDTIVLVTAGETYAGRAFYTNESAVIGTDGLNFKAVTLAAARLALGDVGSAVKPVHFADGVPVAGSSTVGSSTQAVYMKAGAITALSETIGSATQPVYLDAGVITQAAASEEAEGSTIAVRDEAGQVLVAEPSEDSAATNKAYVDTADAALDKRLKALESVTLGVANQSLCRVSVSGEETVIEWDTIGLEYDEDTKYACFTSMAEWDEVYLDFPAVADEDGIHVHPRKFLSDGSIAAGTYYVAEKSRVKTFEEATGFASDGSVTWGEEIEYTQRAATIAELEEWVSSTETEDGLDLTGYVISVDYEAVEVNLFVQQCA